MINWSHVDELKTDMADSFDEIVEVFLEEVDEGIAALTDDTESAGLAANLHFLRGAALNLGFTQFAMLCGTGEDMANRSQGDQVDLDAVRRCYRQSRQEFLIGLQRRAA